MTQHGAQNREHVETVVHHAHTYTIAVDGTMDGASTRDPVGYGAYGQAWENNIAVRLENVGDEVVRNPWVVVNGRRRWRTMEEILAAVIEPDMPPAEKARRLWEFARRHRYHCTTADDEVKDTVKMLNVYGYTLCWDEAYTMANLWQAAGLRIRRGMPHGHCTTEVFYDGEFHLLDSDEHLLYLRRDNRTVASEEELAADHDLVKRGHAYGILSQEDVHQGEQAASLFVHAGPRAGGRPFLARHRMDLELRPGEALVWEWADRGKFHGHGARPPRLSNGRLCFRPRLDATFARWALQTGHLTADGQGLAPAGSERESLLVYRVAAPYVCVGGRVRGADDWTVEVSFDGSDWLPVEAGDLDPCFPAAGPARYTYLLRLRATGQRLDQLELETDLQMAPLALPALEVGTNRVEYLDETQGQRRIRITHTWCERSDAAVPAAPSRPRHPELGAAADPAQLTFVWDPVPGAVDYEFRLSAHQDMRYALSPVFEKLVSRTPAAGRAEWRVPRAGLLNPGQSYYWQIRARDASGVWGPWGPVWRFAAEGPGRPLDLRLSPDYAKRTIVLEWTPNPVGTPADHYEVYGSDERGFTAHRTQYDRYAGQDLGTVSCPPNLLGTTTATSMVVVGPRIGDGGGNCPFLRVIAVDGRGRRSCESDLAEAPRPFIYTTPPPRAVVGQSCQYQVRALQSAGDLRSISRGPHRYHSAFRDADRIAFLLDEAPAFVQLDADTGLLTATPGPEHLGYHTITLRVGNGQGAYDIQGFDLEVLAREPAAAAS